MGVNPQGFDPYAYGYDPYAYQAQGPAPGHQGPGLGQTSNSHQPFFLPGAGMPQAHPPEKKEGGGGIGGFFKKVAAVGRGLTQIPGKLLTAAKDIVTFKDPMKSLLAIGTIALSFTPLAPVVIPAAAAYGIFQGGKAVVEGGLQIAQGWSTDDLRMIENGAATAGTGVVVGAASVYGARANLQANGITPKGTGFMQSNRLAWSNGKEAFGSARSVYSGAGGGSAGARAVGERFWQSESNYLRGPVESGISRARAFRSGNPADDAATPGAGGTAATTVDDAAPALTTADDAAAGTGSAAATETISAGTERLLRDVSGGNLRALKATDLNKMNTTELQAVRQTLDDVAASRNVNVSDLSSQVDDILAQRAQVAEPTAGATTAADDTVTPTTTAAADDVALNRYNELSNRSTLTTEELNEFLALKGELATRNLGNANAGRPLEIGEQARIADVGRRAGFTDEGQAVLDDLAQQQATTPPVYTEPATGPFAGIRNNPRFQQAESTFRNAWDRSGDWLGTELGGLQNVVRVTSTVPGSLAPETINPFMAFLGGGQGQVPAH